MRMRRKRRLESRIEECEHLIIRNPEDLCGRWLEKFKYDDLIFDELHVELGCGKGLFTVETAKLEPDVLYIGIEMITNVLILALERADKTGLQNLLFINKPADDLSMFFAPGEVSRIYINFCDPWPANRHKKRRLTGTHFLEIYKQILCPGGEIHFKTDNFPLFEFSLAEFKQNGFNLSDITYDLHENGPAIIMTDYEIKFHEQGKPIYKCIIVTEGVKAQG